MQSFVCRNQGILKVVSYLENIKHPCMRGWTVNDVMELYSMCVLPPISPLSPPVVTDPH